MKTLAEVIATVVVLSFTLLYIRLVIFTTLSCTSTQSLIRKKLCFQVTRVKHAKRTALPTLCLLSRVFFLLSCINCQLSCVCWPDSRLLSSIAIFCVCVQSDSAVLCLCLLSLSAVCFCCLLSAVCAVCAVCCPLSTLRCLLSAVCWLLSAVC